MLTIKIIEPSGHETILQTMRVTMHPTNGTNLGEPTVFYEKPDGSTFHVETGVVYVMNDMGKTVAKYQLGNGQEVPSMYPVVAGNDFSARVA